ncbi:MAG: hypothetical protein ACP5RS_00745 [Thermoplasmata archaeon]
MSKKKNDRETPKANREPADKKAMTKKNVPKPQKKDFIDIEFPNTYGGMVKMKVEYKDDVLSFYDYMTPEGISEDEKFEYLLGMKEMDTDDSKMQHFMDLPYRIDNKRLILDEKSLVKKYVTEDSEQTEEECLEHAYNMLNKYLDYHEQFDDLVDSLGEDEIDDNDDAQYLLEHMAQLMFLGQDSELEENEPVEMDTKHIMASVFCTLIGELQDGELSDFVEKKGIEEIDIQ